MSVEERTVVEIPFGEGRTIAAEVPADLVTFTGEMEELPEIEDFAAALRARLAQPIGTPPLRELAAGKQKVVVLVEDATRTTPVHRILPVLFDELNAAGVADEHMEILTAPGTHRIMTDEEIRAKVGDEAYGRVRISQHDFREADRLVDLGAISAGEGYTIPVQVNRTAMDADLLIGLGNIIPHCGAGYSGGAKIVQPGVCGFATTAATHVTATVLPEIPLGEVDTPCRRGMEEVARTVGLGFIVNVVQDPHHRIVEIVAGDLLDAHRAGVEVSRRAWGVPVPEPADIVIASSYPADIDWWQGEKGLIAAYFAVKQGGVIVFCTPCPEGLEHNHPRLRFWLQQTFAAGIELVKAADPSDRDVDLIAADLGVDNAKIREKATILLVSDGLADDDVALLGYERQPDLQAAVDRALELRPGGTVGVLPYGGDCLPVVG
jgi:nickel-dependent lactate racemase